MPGTAAHGRNAVRRAALARLISLAGTDASALAVSFALYRQTGSTLWLSAGMLITFGLAAVLAPVGGVLADRFDRKRLMVGAELTGAGVFAALMAWHTPIGILALSVIATISGSVFGPAANAAIPNLAGEEHLAWANSLLGTGANLGKTVGRCGAGVIIGLLGFYTVFALDAVSFLCSAVLLMTVRGSFQTERGERRGVSRSRTVWTLALRDPALRALTLCSCAATFATSFSMTAETVLVFHYRAGATGLGALAACWATGMVAGSWYSGRALRRDNEPTGLFVGRLVMGAALATVGLMPAFWPTLGLYLVGGASGGFLLVAAQSIAMRFTFDDSRGRVMAAQDALRTASFGVGVLSAGFGVAALGPLLTYQLVGLGVLASAAPAFGLVRATGGLRSLRPAAASAT